MVQASNANQARRAGCPISEERLIKTILWDNDGVLVDTEELYFDATREAAARVGIELTQEQFRQVSLTAGMSMFQILLDRGVAPERVEELRLERNRVYRDRLLAGVRVPEGIPAALEYLGARYRMGVVTSSLREHFEAAHSSTGLMRHFTFVTAREDYRESKPAPDPYLAAIERYGLDPQECVAVEDSRRGLDSALAASLRCIVIPAGLTRDCDFTGASAVLAEAGGLGEVLRSF